MPELRAWGKGVLYGKGGTTHIHDLLKDCVEYFGSVERYIDIHLLQAKDKASTLYRVSICFCNNCSDYFWFVKSMDEYLAEAENVESILVFLRDTVGLKFDTPLIMYLLKYGNWETALDLLNNYSTPYDVEDILRECDDDDSIDAFKEWLEESNEAEYKKIHKSFWKTK